MRKPYGLIRWMPKEKFACLVHSSHSMSQLLLAIGLVNATTNGRTALKRIAADGLDASHFVKRGMKGFPKTKQHCARVSASKLSKYGVTFEMISEAANRGLRWCSGHKEFISQNRFGHGQSFCRDCVNERAFCRIHCLPLGWYKNKLAEQDGRCYLCRRTAEEANPKNAKLFLDHNHQCCPGERSCEKCARALLCERCNILVGWMESNEAVVKILLTSTLYGSRFRAMT